MDRIHIRPRFKSFYVTTGQDCCCWPGKTKEMKVECVGMRRYRSLPNLLPPIKRGKPPLPLSKETRCFDPPPPTDRK